MEDDELERLLKRLPAEFPPPGILDRIVRRATAMPQQRNWRSYGLWLGRHIFGYQQGSVAYRCAVLLICAVMGFAAGSSYHRTPQPHHTAEIFAAPDLALADDINDVDDAGGNL